MSEVKDLNKLFENTKEAYLKEKKVPDEELQAAIEAGFDALADYLMNECVLDVNGNEYRIAEIEFYYFDKENHPDVFAHCNECQKKSNVFYFHLAGVDITFGNNSYYGGVLIRSLIKIFDNNNEPFVMGPLNISTEFLHNAKEIDNKIYNKLELIITLKEKQYSEKLNFVKSCRVGLNTNSDSNCKKDFEESPKKIHELKEKYVFKPYRYILNDDELIYKLLYRSSDEPTFLAWFLKNENFNISKLNKRLKDLLKNISNETEKEKFANGNKEKKEVRKEFIKFISKKP
jgi:mRNA-degrading endonuclease HigB of HigAB toxin-antitoxin module